MKWLVLFAFLLAAAISFAQPQSPPANAAPSDQPSAPAAQPNTPAKANNPATATPDSPGHAAASQPDSPDSDEPDADESSSHQTRTDIAPPPDDAKNHPDSKSAIEDLVPPPPSASSDVQEFHPWNPMKASKDIQVGDFYFKRGNYKAALDRYKEALYYKENDAIATYRMAVCQEKLGDKDDARKSFEQYLKILPEGPYAKEARASLEKLGKEKKASSD